MADLAHVPRQSAFQIQASLEPNALISAQIRVGFARSCAAMGDFGRAVAVAMPIVASLPPETQPSVSPDLSSWLWSLRYADDYDPVFDDDYLPALKVLMDLALRARNAGELFEHLRYLCRWLEILGRTEQVKWLCNLMHNEAPGTFYAKSDRARYVRQTALSRNMEKYVKETTRLLETDVYRHVKGLFGGQPELFPPD